MTESKPSLWIVELGEGTAHVHLAGFAHLSVPVVELRPGDSHKGLPYEVWAAHLGETVDVATLKSPSAADSSAAVAKESEVDHQLLQRLRRRTGLLFGIPAFIGTLWLLETVGEYPYWGYGGLITLYFVIILVPFVLVWWRITFLMFSHRRMPILTGSAMGWVNITIGVPLVVIAMRSAADPYAKYSGDAYIVFLMIAALGAAFLEGGRSYVRLWRAQQRVTPSPEATERASVE